MRIEDVERLLSGRFYLKVPKHVFLAKEPVIGEVDGIVRVFGAAKRFGDAIFLAPGATEKTVYEEVLHTMGLREPGAKLLSAILAAVPPILPFKRKVKYVKCTGGCGFHHEGLPVEHYILVEGD
mgnify:CR=1 FL=1